MTHGLPTLALSVRQPWAWAIIHGGKDIENRSWRHSNPGLHFRGRVCIHASKGMTRDEYEDASETIAHIHGSCPAAADLLRGGIIGVVDIVEIVRESDSRWWAGPRGLVLANPVATDFVASAGALGFFNWAATPDGQPDMPAKWMRTAAAMDSSPVPVRQEGLF